MNELIAVFTKYIKDNYDTDNALVIGKYNHSITVANIMLELARRKGFSEEDQKLAFAIGLFHDLGRFYEVKKNQEFNNLRLDHGAYSNKILYNDRLIDSFRITTNEEIDLIIRKALYFHNKKDFDSRVKTEKEALFVKLLRDADKLDIVKKRIEKGNLNFTDEPTGYLIRSYMNDQPIDLKFKKSKSDIVILYLSFIKDLSFPESQDYAREYHLLENFKSVVQVSENNQKLFDILIKRIEEREDKIVTANDTTKRMSYFLWKEI